jgi:hypothetical protein
MGLDSDDARIGAMLVADFLLLATAGKVRKD